ncbi:MAG: hypothetical protein WC635_12210 [Bacteriovorax sp.]|jgi:hypothetical protein
MRSQNLIYLPTEYRLNKIQYRDITADEEKSYSNSTIMMAGQYRFTCQQVIDFTKRISHSLSAFFALGYKIPYIECYFPVNDSNAKSKVIIDLKNLEIRTEKAAGERMHEKSVISFKLEPIFSDRWKSHIIIDETLINNFLQFLSSNNSALIKSDFRSIMYKNSLDGSRSSYDENTKYIDFVSSALKNLIMDVTESTIREFDLGFDVLLNPTDITHQNVFSFLEAVIFNPIFALFDWMTMNGHLKSNEGMLPLLFSENWNVKSMEDGYISFRTKSITDIGQLIDEYLYSTVSATSSERSVSFSAISKYKYSIIQEIDYKLDNHRQIAISQFFAINGWCNTIFKNVTKADASFEELYQLTLEYKQASFPPYFQKLFDSLDFFLRRFWKIETDVNNFQLWLKSASYLENIIEYINLGLIELPEFDFEQKQKEEADLIDIGYIREGVIGIKLRELDWDKSNDVIELSLADPNYGYILEQSFNFEYIPKINLIEADDPRDTAAEFATFYILASPNVCIKHAPNFASRVRVITYRTQSISDLGRWGDYIDIDKITYTRHIDPLSLLIQSKSNIRLSSVNRLYEIDAQTWQENDIYDLAKVYQTYFPFLILKFLPLISAAAFYETNKSGHNIIFKQQKWADIQSEVITEFRNSKYNDPGIVLGVDAPLNWPLIDNSIGAEIEISIDNNLSKELSGTQKYAFDIVPYLKKEVYLSQNVYRIYYRLIIYKTKDVKVYIKDNQLDYLLAAPTSDWEITKQEDALRRFNDNDLAFSYIIYEKDISQIPPMGTRLLYDLNSFDGYSYSEGTTLDDEAPPEEPSQMLKIKKTGTLDPYSSMHNVFIRRSQRVEDIIDVIPIEGDVIEYIDLALILLTGKDKWGKGVTIPEFAIRAASAGIPFFTYKMFRKVVGPGLDYKSTALDILDTIKE